MEPCPRKVRSVSRSRASFSVSAARGPSVSCRVGPEPSRLLRRRPRPDHRQGRCPRLGCSRVPRGPLTGRGVRLATPDRPDLVVLGQQLHPVLFWNVDTTRMAATLHKDMVQMGLSNALTTPGAVRMLGTPVDLTKITVDTYVIVAFQNPRRCRRLVLAATATGALMVPARPSVLTKMLTPAGSSTATVWPRSPRPSTAAAPISATLTSPRSSAINWRPDPAAAICTSCWPGRCGRACSPSPRSANPPSSSPAPTTRSFRSSTPTSWPGCCRTPPSTHTPRRPRRPAHQRVHTQPDHRGLPRDLMRSAARGAGGCASTVGWPAVAGSNVLRIRWPRG